VPLETNRYCLCRRISDVLLITGFHDELSFSPLLCGDVWWVISNLRGLWIQRLKSKRKGNVSNWTKNLTSSWNVKYGWCSRQNSPETLGKN
jgi:hypothetical protein